MRLAAQRQLAFDEPVSRLARLKKTVQKQLPKNQREKLRELTVYQLAELHGSIFTPEDMPCRSFVLSLAISLAFVLEDFRLYSATAFAAFAILGERVNQAGASDQIGERKIEGEEAGDGCRTRAVLALSDKLAENLKLSAERRIWLQIALLSTIDWTALTCAASVPVQDRESDATSGGTVGKPPGLAAPALGTGSGANQEELDMLKWLPKLLQLVDKDVDYLAADWSLTAGSILPLLDCPALLMVAEKAAAALRENFRPSLIVLVEGQSELIVLPHFARLVGEPLESIGALVIASGGAKQVARRYLTMKDVLKIPIVCVFDGDAQDSAAVIEEALRDCDRLFCLEAGELEDCYSYEQLLKILARQLALKGQGLSGDAVNIPRQGPRKQALNKLFRSRGLGDFDKIEFAKSTVSLTRSREDVPEEITRVIAFVARTSQQFCTNGAADIE